MPKAGDVAKELRRVAEALEREPETEIQDASLWFHCRDKDIFRNTVGALPKPLTKRIFLPDSKYPDLHVEHEGDILRVVASIPQKLTCRLLRPAQPAVYDCEPILSPDEELQ